MGALKNEMQKTLIKAIPLKYTNVNSKINWKAGKMLPYLGIFINPKPNFNKSKAITFYATDKRKLRKLCTYEPLCVKMVAFKNSEHQITPHFIHSICIPLQN